MPDGFPSRRSAAISARHNSKETSPPARRRRMTDREDRAMIRILTNHGVHPLEIARRIGFSPRTVGNILGRRSHARDDENKDYDFVSEAFKAKFPSLSPSESRARLMRREKELKSEMLDQSLSRKTAVYLSNSRLISRSQSQSAGPSASAAGTSARRLLISYRSRPKATIHGTRHNPIEIDPDPRTTANNIPGPQTVIEFLSNLDHDLSGVFATLKAQDLGTPRQLFAVVAWPEETLHQLFREVLPNTSVTQRFVLIKGLKDFAMEK